MSIDVSRPRNSKVRPPKWEVSRPRSPTARLPIEELRRLQEEYLCIFRAKALDGKWSEIHCLHFDWWQFPIDDGSRPEFNLKSQSDVNLLKSDPIWLAGYLESVEILAKSWGWDVKNKCVDIASNGRWDRKDVRLAKIIRSLWLFELREYFVSMQKFAFHINEKEYSNRGFFYGSICLDEILFMTLI